MIIKEVSKIKSINMYLSSFLFSAFIIDMKLCKVVHEWIADFATYINTIYIVIMRLKSGKKNKAIYE